MPVPRSRSVRAVRATVSVAATLAMFVLVSACTGSKNGGGHGSASTSAIARNSVVAFVGDSYTVGYGASAPTSRWSSLVAQHFGWVEKNFGIGGTGYAAPPPYLTRIAQVAAARPSAVVISGGFNDLVQGVVNRQFQQAAAATFAALRSALPAARIIAIRPFFPPAPPPAKVATFGGDVRQAVVAAGGTYLDIGSPLSGLSGVVVADQIHPNDAGYRLLAEAVEKAVSTLH